jgi:hypothetical protein
MMKYLICTRRLAILLMLAVPPASFCSGPELWFYNSTNLAVPANVKSTEALIDRASAAGYSRMILADDKLLYDGNPNLVNIWNPGWGYTANLQAVVAYGASKGVQVVPSTFDVGRADSWLLPMVDENLAEGQQVIGANFKVAANGKSLDFIPQDPVMINRGFEEGAKGWNLGAHCVIDRTTAHTGVASLRVNPVSGGGGWAIQTLTVIPNRQYHVRFWAKTRKFNGDLLVKIYDPAVGVFRESHEGDSALNYAATQAWRRYDYVFNSAGSTQLQLRVGTWDSSTTGTMWFDDVDVVEIALHNVVVNTGSPVKVYLVDGTPLTIGKDVNPIRENYTPGHGITYALFRKPLTVTIPRGSSLKPRDPVKIDYDAVQPVYDGQYGSSLTESEMLLSHSNNITEILSYHAFPAGTGYFLGGYDEIRHGNSSSGARTLGLDAGPLLAQAFTQSCNLIRAQDPAAPIYTWSDMFDPYHNAVNNYYLWNGNLSGSWLGLPQNVVIFNWNLGKLTTSLQYFAGLGHQQVIAGYYDAQNGTTEGAAEAREAAGVPGVRGLMYTTWTNNWTQLENYAAGAASAWVATLPTVSAINDQSTAVNTATSPLPFQVTGALLLTASSSNLTLAPAGSLLLSGSGAARTITVTPAANQSGSSLITITASNGLGNTASSSFNLTVH